MQYWVDYTNSLDGPAKEVCNSKPFYEFSIESFLDYRGCIF